MSLSVCFAHLDDVANVVADAVRTAGGLPFEIRTTAPSDFVTSAGRKACYLMPTRDLVVNDVEAAVEGAVLDGMVLLSSCDKTTHLMAAARLDLPSVLVIGGYPTRRYRAGCSVSWNGRPIPQLAWVIHFEKRKVPHTERSRPT